MIVCLYVNGWDWEDACTWVADTGSKSDTHHAR